MAERARTLRFGDAGADPTLEWIVTNGLGGYASGPVRGGLSRRFHGVLIASLPAPIGRLMCLNHLAASIIDAGKSIAIDDLHGASGARLVSFSLDDGLPVWRYEIDDYTVERRLVMPYGQNTTHVLWRRVGGTREVVLRLQPYFQVRAHEGRVTAPAEAPRSLRATGSRVDIDIAPDLPSIQWSVGGDRVTPALDRAGVESVEYDIERARGYDHAGGLWTPGWFDVACPPDGSATFSVSTEGHAALDAVTPADALATEHARRTQLISVAGDPADPIVAELTLAADQFIVAPVGRAEEVARIRAAGDEPRTVIAGYHWFTDWGRDTMISLEGLTIATGRSREAGCILRTFAHHIRDGLIPNMFPEGARVGLYHTADATLWFFHALDRYLEATRDLATLTTLLPVLIGVAEHHVRGTHFGIGVDPYDGLLRQGADGYQLTWMDAKVGDWVVTPRRGKAVEINALWFNAVSLLAKWLVATGRQADARHWQAVADRTAEAFNRRFWNPATGHLFDVVDGEHGDDPACRPNQVFAISLDFPVLHPDRWHDVLACVRAKLLTPLGLRTLSPDHPDYKATYDGDLHARDAAYHQGTVWAWLIGPFVDAWKRAYPDEHTAGRSFLAGLVDELGRAGVGTISEIFDAREPYTPRGCIAQAWSVAEVLRVYRSL